MRSEVAQQYRRLRGLGQEVAQGLYFLLNYLNITTLGAFGLVLVPLTDMLKAYSAYLKIQLSEDLDLGKSLEYKVSSFAFHFTKAVVTYAAFFMLLVGMAPLAMIFFAAAQASVAFKEAAKVFWYLSRGENADAAKHAGRFLVSAAFAAAFILCFVVVAFQPIAYLLALGAFTAAALTRLYPMAKETADFLDPSPHQSLQDASRDLSTLNNTNIKPIHRKSALFSPQRSIFKINNQLSTPIDKLGKGAYGVTKKHLLLDWKHIAVKRLLSQFNGHSDDETVERQVFEKNVTQEVNIIKAMGRYRGHGYTHKGHVLKAYIAMEHHDGVGLEVELAKPWEKWNTVCIVKIMLSMLQEVNKLHGLGYVHIDIKPENFIVNTNTQQAYLIDFGLSLKIGEASAYGTYGYFPPELDANSTLPRTTAGDVYQLSLVFASLLKKGAGVDEGISDLVLPMQSKNPEDRPTIPQLIEALTRLDQSSKTSLKTSL